MGIQMDEFYFIATDDRAGDIWAVSLDDGSEQPMADLSGRMGQMGRSALATDGTTSTSSGKKTSAISG